MKLRLFLYFFCFSFLCFYSISYAREPSLGDTVCSPINCYTLEEELGEGAFGKVFLVKDKEENTFAMKWYKERPYEGKDSAFNLLGDAQREFDRGQSLSHPSIVQTYELFSDDAQENHFLILDFIEGTTLHRTPRKSFSYENCSTTGLQLAEIMFYSYEQGYLYLDMHGDNFMIDTDTNIKLIDLAGFFSFEELELLYNKSPQKKGLAKEDCEKKIENQFGPKRGAMIKAFLRENPAFSKSFQQKRAQKGAQNNLPQRWLLSYWLDRLTEREVDIFMKSNMERDSRLDVREKLKRLAWEYSEDVADGVPTFPMNVYFERLIAILK